MLLIFKQLMFLCSIFGIYASSTAWACSCTPDEYFEIIPDGRCEDGFCLIDEQDSVILYYHGSWAMFGIYDIRLKKVDEDGETIEVGYLVDELSIVNGVVWRIMPEEGWIAEHKYELTVNQISELASSNIRVSTGIEEDPLMKLTIASAERVYESDLSTGDCHMVYDTINVEVDAVYAQKVLYEFEVSEDKLFSDPDVIFSPYSTFSIGQFGCDATWLDMDPKKDYYLRVRGVDLSGDVGPWSDPVHVRRGDADGDTKGCNYDKSSKPGSYSGSSTVISLLIAFWLVFMRRLY